MIRKFALLATVAAGIVALPAIALAQHEGHDGPKGPTTRAELQKTLEQKFAEIDANKDGVITKAEADAQREKMKKQWAEKRTERRDERFAAMDANKDGQISKAEFDAAHAARSQKWADARKEGLREDGDGDRKFGRHGMRGHMNGGDMFARLDANKDGKVTRAEFTAKPLAMFDRADANKDGTVTPEERKAAWEKMRSEWKAKKGATAKPAA